VKATGLTTLAKRSAAIGLVFAAALLLPSLPAAAAPPASVTYNWGHNHDVPKRGSRRLMRGTVWSSWL
jgi:hypothetical protein